MADFNTEIEQLEADIVALGEPKFRAAQIFDWLSRGVRDFDKMSNLSKALREKLKNEYYKVKFCFPL